MYDLSQGSEEKTLFNTSTTDMNDIYVSVGQIIVERVFKDNFRYIKSRNFLFSIGNIYFHSADMVKISILLSGKL